MTCVILQPSYIPWRGYFHQIQKADLFVFYDDVQYDRHGWRNRNLIKTPAGPKWLTIPVHSTGAALDQTAICEMRTAPDEDWPRKHLETLRHNYVRAPYFVRYSPMLEDWYRKRPARLADFTIETTIQLARELGIGHTRFLLSSSLGCTGAKTERLLSILRCTGATRYLSGPAARAYLDVELLNSAGIEVEWMTYNYPPYPQLYPPFDGQLSALDLLLNTGPEAHRYVWGGASTGTAPPNSVS